MNTVRKIYLKDFLLLLCLITVGLSSILSVLDLIGHIDNFMPNRPSFFDLALYAIYNIPRFLIYLLPMSVLICSLFTFSQAFRRGEITAIKSAGGRLRVLMYPFIAAGILLSIFSFFVTEVVAPDFSLRAVELKHVLSGLKSKSSFSEGVLWLKSKNGHPVKIDLFILDESKALGIKIFIFGDAFIKEQIIAEKASWNGSTWILENVTRYNFETDVIEKVRNMPYPDLESPDFFAEDIRKPAEMGISELHRYSERLRAAGFRDTKLIVDLNAKISFPLITAFMMLLGLSLSTREMLGGGLVSAGLGLLISLIYWFGYTFTLSLGYAGILHPFLAAWVVPAAFGFFSVHLFRRIPE
jgi:LPS export ABC transporter permease LptG